MKDDEILWIKPTPNMEIWPEEQKITLTDKEISELEAYIASRPTQSPYQPSEAVLKLLRKKRGE